MRIPYIFRLLGLMLIVYQAKAQVIIGHQVDKAIDKKHSLLELKVDNSKDTAQAFMLPLAKTAQRDKITNYPNGQSSGSGQQSTNGQQKFPRGGMLYDVNANKITVHVQKDDKTGNEWRYLAYLSADTAIPILIARDSNAIEMPNSGSDATAGQKTITIKSPTGYVPYTYNRKTNPNGGYVPLKPNGTNGCSTSSGGETQNGCDSVIVSLSYNGYTLTPYEDYKAEVDKTHNSGNSGDCKIKVTFLSFEPEYKQDFDKVFVQYVRKKQ